MSLYHEGAEVLVASSTEGGSLKSRIFGRRNIKSTPGQLYALVFETCKWSSVLKEVIDASSVLLIEKKVRISCRAVYFFLVTDEVRVQHADPPLAHARPCSSAGA